MHGMDDGARSRMERAAARLRSIHDQRVAQYRSRQLVGIEPHQDADLALGHGRFGPGGPVQAAATQRSRAPSPPPGPDQAIATRSSIESSK